MALQLHYTSAPSGLEHRAGFQFVGASPAATTAVRQAVAPYLNYRPPPSAPTHPTQEQLAGFPISYCFQRAAIGLILVQCRYLGEDYSGRPGNFLGHAVVAAESDLNGLRPIELWRSSLWSDHPAAADLPEVTEFTPGRGSEPEAVLDRLHAQGERGYRLLSELVDATLASLDGDAGQVVLVADRAETVAAWIAAISYSLPLATALELSFVTYTADPDRARQRLVGTSAEASAVMPVDAQAFLLDAGAVDLGDRPAPSRYAATVTAAWRRRDLVAIDALCELASIVGGAGGGTPAATAASATLGREEREATAALAALSSGEPIPGAEAAIAAHIVRRHGDRLPASLLTALAAQPADRLGLDLLHALHDTVVRTSAELARQMGGEWLALALRSRNYHDAPPQFGPLSPAQRQTTAPLLAHAVRAATDLDDLTALLMLARAGDLPVEPATLRAATVRAVGRAGNLDAAYDALAHDEEQRIAFLDGVVEGLARADGPRLRAVLTPAACDRLMDLDWSLAPRVGGYVLVSHGQRHPTHRLSVTETLADLGDRRLLSTAAVDHAVGLVWQGTQPAVAECLRLVGALSAASVRRDGVLELTRRAFAAGDIRGAEAAELARRLLAVVDYGPAAADAATVLALHKIINGQLGDGCVSLDRAFAYANPAVAKKAARYAYDRFGRAKPQVQAEVIIQLPPRSRLREQLVHRLVKSAADVDLVEVAARLAVRSRPDDTLSAHTLKLTRQQFRLAEIRAALSARDRRLVKGFDDLVAHRRRFGLFGRLIRRDGDG